MKGVLIVGGYGVVGSQVAKFLRNYNADLPIYIAGRSLEKAELFAKQLGNAQAIKLDINHPTIADDLPINTILALVNDPQDKLLELALSKGITYLDITRWTSRLIKALAYTFSFNNKNAPVIFASSWMASVPATIIKSVASDFSHIDNINIAILYALKDNAGPNSTEYMDRLSLPFRVKEKNEWKSYLPFREKKIVDFSASERFSTFRFDAPDQLTLPGLLSASSVSTWIGFNDEKSNGLLFNLIRSGIWKLLPKSLRRSILFNPGAGDKHHIQIEISGQNSKNDKISKIINIIDPKGQTHLTALGASIITEQLLTRQSENIIAYGEQFSDPSYLLARLQENGVTISIEDKR